MLRRDCCISGHERRYAGVRGGGGGPESETTGSVRVRYRETYGPCARASNYYASTLTAPFAALLFSSPVIHAAAAAYTN